MEKDYSLKIKDLPWPDDYYARDDEIGNEVYVVTFDDWSIDLTPAKKRIEKDKLIRHKKKIECERIKSAKKLKRLILYLYCKNLLFQMAFLYYQFAYELGYRPPHRAYFRILTLLFMRVWSSVEH